MPNFQPLTTIYLCKDTGLDQYNKPYFDNNDAMVQYFQKKIAKTCLVNSYQRGDERQYATIECEYDIALACDAIIWRNQGESEKWYIAGITGVEWVNPSTVRVYFEIDAYCTWCGDIEWQPCFVEREHVKDDWSGTAPNFNVMGVDEGITCNPDVVISEYENYYTPDRYVVVSPYIDLFTEMQFGGTIIRNIYNGLNMAIYNDAAGINSFLTSIASASEANVNNVIGIFSVPHAMLDGLDETIDITSPWETQNGKFNNAKCYSSAFTTVEINSLIANTVTYKPELFQSSNQLHFRINSYFVGGAGGLLVNPMNYAGSDFVKEFGVSISEVPQGAWLGDAYAQWAANNMISTTLGALANTISSTAAGFAMGSMTGIPQVGLVTGAISGLSSIAQYESTIKNAQTNGVVTGGKVNTNANLATAYGAYGFVIRCMQGNEPFMKSIDAYFDRFGYKVNLLKIPEVDSRPKWNYVKTKEAHIAGTIPKNYREQIESMLNNGVTFWHTGMCDIGNYSDPAGNKE